MGNLVKKKSKRKPVRWQSVEWVAVGADVSTYSISLAGMAKLGNGKLRSAKAVTLRWEKDTDYFKRIRDASQCQNLMFDLFAALKVEPELVNVFIAVEEAVSFGHMQRHQSKSMKQQLQISGAFLGGLLRWGWNNLYEIQANQWRKYVAEELGITTHHTKWGKGRDGKYRSQEWVENFHPKWDGKWPDIISAKRGMIPRPEGSKAQGVQPDDRYDALGIMWWMRKELK